MCKQCLQIASASRGLCPPSSPVGDFHAPDPLDCNPHMKVPGTATFCISNKQTNSIV